MPSYDQLDNEAAWRAEFTPPALARLADGLRAHWSGSGVWVRGDNDHLRGYHRSRRWIKESQYCTSRTYSVSRTTGDRSGGDSNWCCALDLGNIAQSELHAACKRLDAAVRAGQLEKITEWYGNFGGDLRVDGYDNISNQMASADSSHLYHLHISFDRGRANEDHSDVLAVLTGGIVATQQDVISIWQHYLAPNGYNMQDHLLNTENQAASTNAKLTAFVAAEETRDAVTLAAIQALSGGGGNIDTAVILERINAQANATRDLVEQQHAAEMAELARIHAAQMAEKQAEVAGLQAELDRLTAAS